jgi:Mce-associated membrane protein
MSDSSRSRLNLWLSVAAVLLLAVAAVGGVTAWQAKQQDDRTASQEESYGQVMSAARKQAEAFININYQDAQTSMAAVAAGATGKFKEQYSSSSDGVISVLKQNKSVMEGRVVWTGVVSLDKDDATVLVATTGTVANVSTHNQPVARNFRLQLHLVKSGTRWLADDLQWVS